MINVSPRELDHRALPAVWTQADSAWAEMVIHEVSEDGFSLKGAHALQPGDLIEVWLEACSVVGEVHWSRSEECGVRALEPLALEQFEVGQLTSDRQATPGAVRLRPLYLGQQRERPSGSRKTGSAFIVVISAVALASALVVAALRA